MKDGGHVTICVVPSVARGKNRLITINGTAMSSAPIKSAIGGASRQIDSAETSPIACFLRWIVSRNSGVGRFAPALV